MTAAFAFGLIIGLFVGAIIGLGMLAICQLARNT
jgi:hypothetical protein